MTGRPRGTDSRQRQRELLRLLSEGHDLAAAAREAHVKPETVLRLLSEADYRAVVVALLEGRKTAVAVTLAEPVQAGLGHEPMLPQELRDAA